MVSPAAALPDRWLADWERSGQYASRTEQTTGADAHAFADALSQCMTDKGYRSR